jgi:hypothetical protein
MLWRTNKGAAAADASSLVDVDVAACFTQPSGLQADDAMRETLNILVAARK